MTGRCLFGFSGEKPFLLPDNEGVKMNTSPVRMDDLPLNRFHCRIAALTFGAHLTDGYVLGVIGYAIIQLTPAMQLTPFMAGMIGGSALLGLFLGSLVLGWISDHIGRQKIFTFSFLLITLASFLQFFATTPEHLIGLRILIGIGLGGDYSVGHTLLAEFSPRRHRGILLGAFSVYFRKPGGLALATGIGSSARVVDYVITLGNARITTLATAPGAFCRSSRYRASLFWSPCFTGR